MKLTFNDHLINYLKENDPQTEAQMATYMLKTKGYSDKYFCDRLRVMLRKKLIDRDKRKNSNNRMTYHYFIPQVSQKINIPGTTNNIVVPNTTELKDKWTAILNSLTQPIKPPVTTEHQTTSKLDETDVLLDMCDSTSYSQFELSDKIMMFIKTSKIMSHHSAEIKTAIKYQDPFEIALNTLLQKGLLVKNGVTNYMTPKPYNTETLHQMMTNALVGSKAFWKNMNNSTHDFEPVKIVSFNGQAYKCITETEKEIYAFPSELRLSKNCELGVMPK